MLAEPLKAAVGATGFHGTRFENHWSRLALMLTQSLVSWVPDALPMVRNDPVMKLTTHLQLVPGLRMCGVVPPPSFLAWC
jgi:hypothetical protein